MRALPPFIKSKGKNSGLNEYNINTREMDFPSLFCSIEIIDDSYKKNCRPIFSRIAVICS